MAFIRFIIITLCLLISNLILGQHQLQGTWKRVQDEAANEEEFFEGNILQVKLSDNKWIGELIQVVPDASRYGYKPGMIKWSNFQQIIETKFLMEVLLMDYDDDFKFRKKVYLKSNLLIIDHNTIKIRIMDHPRLFSGQLQKYIRVDLEDA